MYNLSAPVVIESSSLDGILQNYVPEQDRWDTYISRSADSHQSKFHPFIGNGKFALDLSSDSPFYIHGRRSLDLSLPFHPLVQVEILDPSKESATVIRFVEGTFHRVTTFSYMNKIAVIFETIYAHRSIPSLLVQEISVSNPAGVSLQLHLKRTGWKGKQAVKSEPLETNDSYKYTLMEGEIRAQEGNKINAFIIAVPEIAETADVLGGSNRKFTFKTFLNYTKPTSPSRLSLLLPPLKSSIQDSAKRFQDLPPSSLLRYHTESWHDLWKSGFGISESKAEGSLNGDVINATIYYILCQKSSIPIDPSLKAPTDMDVSKTNFLLNHPDRCYANLPTVQAPNLWSDLSSLLKVQRVTSLWLLTLEKNGCQNLLSAGAEGTLQAVILSFVGMQFHQNHLEMGIHPKELHRDYFLRRIRYNNATFVNITMSVGEDYKSSLYVILDKNDDNSEFFGCDAGCLDPPVPLSSSVQMQFPVKITEPQTPILYVTSNRQHIQELKHTIHVKEVAVAPAHETHVIALHRHGHRFGGLPTIFWIIIICLIVIFHIFLGKLIYAEYWGGGIDLRSSSGLSSSSSSHTLINNRRTV